MFILAPRRQDNKNLVYDSEQKKIFVCFPLYILTSLGDERIEMSGDF